MTAGYERVDVLRSVSLEVPAGTVVALLGSNGAGKSTLLRTISGFLPARNGEIRLHGCDITGMKPSDRAAAGLCHVPEGRGIYRTLTVRENLTVQALADQETKGLERAATAFPALGERLEQRAGTLSGGQQQMLALAAAYVRRPDLILIDEASLGLAPIVVDDIFAFIEGRAEEGAAILIVDQFAARALALADRAYVLRKGEIAFNGTAQELLASDLLAHYLGAGVGDDTDDGG